MPGHTFPFDPVPSCTKSTLFAMTLEPNSTHVAFNDSLCVSSRVLREKNCPVIGQGTFGVVYKSPLKLGSTRLAQKTVNIYKHRSANEGVCTSRNTACIEALLQRVASHGCNNILDVLGYTFEYDPVKDQHMFHITTELMETTLFHVITNQGAIHMDLGTPLVAHIAYQLLQGVHHLHKLYIAHRDIKPSNILLSLNRHSDGTAITWNYKGRSYPEVYVKLGDFGTAISSSSFVPSDVELPAHTMTDVPAHDMFGMQTPSYAAPEVLLGSIDYGLGCDVWSAGMVIWHMLHNNLPAAGCNNDSEILEKYFSIYGFPSKELWPGIDEMYFFKNNRRKLLSWDRRFSGVVTDWYAPFGEDVDHVAEALVTVMKRSLCVVPTVRDTVGGILYEYEEVFY